MPQPIMIVGPPRTASSYVAKIVQDCGVYIGNRFVEFDFHDQDTYEDADFADLNKLFIQEKISHAEFQERLNALRNERSSVHSLWGLKEPRAYKVIGDYISTMHPRFIRTHRPAHRTIESMERTFKWDHQTAYKTYNAIQYILDAALEDQETVDIQWSDIIENTAHSKIENFING